MWMYASLVKLLNLPESSRQMHNQPFPPAIADLLVFAVPTVELIVVMLLLFPLVLKLGYLASIFLLTVFTIYILLIESNAFGHIPCSCGGIISGFSWTEHLLFNLFFLALSILGLIFTKTERRSRGTAA